MVDLPTQPMMPPWCSEVRFLLQSLGTLNMLSAGVAGTQCMNSIDTAMG